MSEAVILAIISNAFWLIILLLVLGRFHGELKSLLSSIGGFTIAGAQFEFTDKRSTLQSYAILSDIFVQILLQRESVHDIVRHMSNSNAHQLAKFTIKYTEEVQQRHQDPVLLKNVALIMGYKGRYQDAIVIYDALLKQTPGEPDLLALKAVALFNTDIPAYIVSSEHLLDDLVAGPSTASNGSFWYNRSLTKSVLGKYDQAIADLEQALALGYRKPKMLENNSFKVLRQEKPNEFMKLGADLERLRDSD